MEKECEWIESDKCPYCGYEDSDIQPNKFDWEFEVRCKCCRKKYEVKTKTKIMWYTHVPDRDPRKYGWCESEEICSDYGNCEDCKSNENTRYDNN